MQIECEGRVIITLPQREEYGEPQRVTTGTCPDHGPFRIVERYDVETGMWEVVSRFTVQESNTQRTDPEHQPPTPQQSSSA